MKPRKTKRLLHWGALALVLCLFGPVWSQNTTPSQFPLKSTSVTQLNPSVKMYVLSGMSVQCLDTPNPAVKIQAKTKSETAVHGSFKVNGNPLISTEGTPVYFTLGHSEGTKNAYNTLYMDLNQDLDLSNDAAVTIDSEFPQSDLKLLGNKAIVFKPMKLAVGDKQLSLRLIVRQLEEDITIASISPTHVMRGKITIGSKKHDMILTHLNTLSPNYNQVWTSCFLDGQRNGDTGLIADWPTEDGVLYELVANEDGSQVTVQPYSAGFGTLNLVTSQGKPVKITETGYLLSQTRLIDLARCPKKNGVPEIPAGDYLPVAFSAQVGDTTVVLQFKPDSKNPVTNPYSIKIQKDNAASFTLPATKDVVFTWSNSTKQFKAGDQMQFTAALCDSDTGLAVSGITKNAESVDPTVTILDHNGKIVTQGKMPFG